VGAFVAAFVGAFVVGLVVGAAVGAFVGAAVGALVGTGDAVGAAVGVTPMESSEVTAQSAPVHPGQHAQVQVAVLQTPLPLVQPPGHVPAATALATVDWQDDP